MPIYEYECASCGHRLEALQKIADEPLRDCPECGKPSLRRAVTAAGFRLKGTGWYVTDFRDKGKKQPDSKSGAPAKGGTAAKGGGSGSE